jgi:hypothetical protein
VAGVLIVRVSHMLRQPKPSSLCLYFLSCAMFLFSSGSHAQENCDVEVKLLLSPAQTQSAVAELSGSKEKLGRVYFFDTDSLDLLSQGAIVRLRQGAKNDLTVKLRPPHDKKTFSAPSKGRDLFNCEVDLAGNEPTPSYSVTIRFAAKQLPQTGYDISRLLSSAQMRLLNGVSVDWTRVKRIAEIRSTNWRTQSQSHLGKLTLELWKWPGGEVLELSKRVSSEAGSSTYTELKNLAKKKRLVVSRDQGVKTRIALEAITQARAH